jgi:Holliday junction resolvase
VKEATLVAKALRKIRAAGGWAIKVHGSVYSFVGAPDIIACLRGRFLVIECKVPGKQPRLPQSIQGRRLITAGAKHLVAYDIFDVERAIDEILEEE